MSEWFTIEPVGLRLLSRKFKIYGTSLNSELLGFFSSSIGGE
ncbi:hypothetical protein [Methanomethylovorans sp. PtaU1.Bin093]|jgi:hypothetical protein|nr:hypothetical protein [Methanomethylovorans sp. PtaU1.Bin093]